MKIQILSDLHLEFEGYEYPHCDADVVVLAGDIHVKFGAIDWILKHIPDKPVIYVLGNHEFYGKSHPQFITDIKSKALGTNIHILEKEKVVIGGVAFLGCTLWTDFALFGNSKVAGYLCQQIMTDYKEIRRSSTYSKLRSIDTAVIHFHSLKWLHSELSEIQGKKTIIVTHHGPSPKSLPERKKDEIVSSAYVSDLEPFISTHHPSYWVHGHLHNSCEYNVGECSVICNPKGYPEEGNDQFDSEKCIEL